MKTTLTILLIAIAINGTAQTWAEKPKEEYYFVSVHTDAQNLFFGSKPTQYQSALDVQLTGGIKLSSGIQLALQVETFPNINYANYIFSTGYVFQIGNSVELVTSIGAGQIIRKGDYASFGFFTYEANGETRIKISKNIGISVKGNLQRRPDVPEIKYRFSGYGGVFYRF